MIPLKIAPKDIHITFEISANQLESIVDYLEKLNPFASKILIGEEVDAVLKDIDDFLKVAKEILEHPLVKGGA